MNKFIVFGLVVLIGISAWSGYRNYDLKEREAEKGTPIEEETARIRDQIAEIESEIPQIEEEISELEETQAPVATGGLR